MPHRYLHSLIHRLLFKAALERIWTSIFSRKGFSALLLFFIYAPSKTFIPSSGFRSTLMPKLKSLHNKQSANSCVKFYVNACDVFAVVLSIPPSYIGHSVRRVSWITNCKTKTTLYSSPHYTEDSEDLVIWFNPIMMFQVGRGFSRCLHQLQWRFLVK